MLGTLGQASACLPRAAPAALPPDGSKADFYPALRSPSAISGAGYILSQQTFLSGALGTNGGAYALQNPTLNPVDVTIHSIGPLGGMTRTITIAPGDTLVHNIMVNYGGAGSGGPNDISFASPTALRSWTGGDAFVGLSAVWVNDNQGCGSPSSASGNGSCWLALAGSGPASRTLRAISWLAVPQFPVPYTAMVNDEAAPWLSLPSTRGVSCPVEAPCTQNLIPVTANPAGLAPGDYQATVRIIPDDPAFTTVIVPFTYRIANSAVSFVSPTPNLYWNARGSDPPPPTIGVSITATVDGTPFTITATNSVDGTKADWLLVTPTTGVTPATLQVTADPSKVQFAGEATLAVKGPSNSVSLPVGLANSVPPSPISINPSSLTFWAKAGSGFLPGRVSSTGFGPAAHAWRRRRSRPLL